MKDSETLFIWAPQDTQEDQQQLHADLLSVTACHGSLGPVSQQRSVSATSAALAAGCVAVGGR